MLKQFLTSIFLLFISFNSIAGNIGSQEPKYIFMPNIISHQLSVTQPAIVDWYHKQAIDLVRKTLSTSSTSVYEAVRIRFIYDISTTPKAIIVYLLSSQDKSAKVARIDITDKFTVSKLTGDYQVTAEDVAQSPNYAYPYQPKCPDNNVQFVIGNSFTNHPELELEVLKVYAFAKEKGYNPVLMDVNNPSGPQPTVRGFLDWMSCPNVKGFYNESHGHAQGILLSDDELQFRLIERSVPNKLKDDVVLFDSCSTFQDPMLSSMTDKDKGNAQQYMAGIFPLPFGPSEKTAACIWEAAIKYHAQLNQRLIMDCASKSDLGLFMYRIKGNGSDYLRPVGRV